MKQFSSDIRYVEATPRKQRKKSGAYSVISAGVSSSADNSALKSYVDSNFMSLATGQDVSALHNFLNGFNIAGIPFRKTANGQLFIDASVVFGGGVTMYGTDTTPAPSIFDGLPIDNETIYWDNGVLKAMGGGGGGGVADSVAWANVYGKPTWITNTKPTYNYSEIQGTPDLSVYALASSLANYALKTSIPTNNNQLTNGAGYITASALNGYATQTFVNTALAGYLPLSGGTLTNALTVKGSGQPLTVHRTQSSASVVKFVNTDGTLGLLGVSTGKNAIFIEASGAIKTLLHSGNYSDYALPKDGTAASATKLATPRKIWGQSFDGTGDVSGDATVNGILSVASVLRMSDLDGTYKVILQRDSSGNILFGGGFATNNMYIDADVLRIRANNTIFSTANIGTLQIVTNEINGANGTGNAHINYSSTGKVTIANGGGNVVIGGTTAYAKLHVHGGLLTESQSGWSGTLKGGAKSTVYAAHSDGYGLSVMSTAAATDNIYLFRVWRGSLSGTSGTGVAVLDVKANGTIQTSGNLVVGGGITMYSQRSLKNILSYEGLSLKQLSVIKPIKFTWKDGRDNRYHVGGVADDVETVVPEVVYSANDFLTMDYGNAGFYVAASLIKPVLDHEQRIKILEQENKALREEINQLRQSA